MNFKRLVLTALGITALGVVPQQSAQAQQGGGVELTFDISQSLRASDNYSFIRNPSGDSFVGVTGLTFGLLSETAVSTLTASMGTDFEAGYFADKTGGSSRFVNSYMRFGYNRDVGTSDFRINGSYSHDDLGNALVPSVIGTNNLVVDRGTRDDYQIGLGVTTGKGGPLGLNFSTSYRKRDFSGTTDPNLNDNQVYNFDGAVRFAVTPVLDLSVLAGYRRYTAEDAVDTENVRTNYGLGWSYEVSPALRFSGSITQNENDRTRGIGAARTTTTRSGTGFDIGFVQDRPNGVITGRFDTQINSTGRRDTLRFGRDLLLPRGALSFSLGVTQSDLSDAKPFADVTYQHDFKTATFTTKLSQTATVDNNNNEVLRTRLALNYNQQINAISSWDAGFTLGDVNTLSGTAADQRRTNITLGYRRDLTQDWSMRTGYQYSVATETGKTDKKANTVFLSIQRSFSVRP